MKKKVSCHIITYNQKEYISNCIDSILMQKTNFSVEIIIGDDNSDDGTREILEGYAFKYPDLIKLNLLEGRGSKIPGKQNFLTTLEMCAGKYIALCEGDDYWTDPLKLQKQVDFLEANPDYVLCFHKIKILMPNGELVDDFITNVPENYEIIETLARLGNYIHTPSVVFRNCIKEFPVEFELSPIGDYFLYLLLAEHGKLKYLQEKMAVYRYGIGVISKMNNFRIAINNIKMYSCMIPNVRDFNIKILLLNRQDEVLNRYRLSKERTNENTMLLTNWAFILKNKVSRVVLKLKKVLRNKNSIEEKNRL